MRSYTIFSPKFWTHGAGKKLRGNSDAIALVTYFFTAPSSNSIGLYYEPLPMIAHATGLPGPRILELLELPAVAQVVEYDTDAELVWLPEHAREQLGEQLKPSDKRRDGVRRELALVAAHRFAAAFVARYGSAFALESKPLSAAADAPSEGLLAGQKPPDPSPSPSLVPDPSPNPSARGAGVSPTPVQVVVSTESPPSNLDTAMQVPLRQRAGYVTARPDIAQWVQPQQWPEVRRIADAFAAQSGHPARLGGYHADKGVQRLVELFAAGYTEAEVLAAVQVLPAQRIWQDAARRTLSMLSLEVVRRTQAHEGQQATQSGLSDHEKAEVDRIMGTIKPIARAV